MPSVKFDEATLHRAKTKQGVYSPVKQSLRTIVINLVKTAFYEYARAHRGCTPQLANEEWERFELFLNKYI